MPLHDSSRRAGGPGDRPEAGSPSAADQPTRLSADVRQIELPFVAAELPVEDPAEPGPEPSSPAAAAVAARARPLPDGAAGLPTSELLSLLGLSARGADVPRKNRIFVNRNLRMDQVDLIGFDMDYTLAIYSQPEIEALSVRCTLEKLVAGRGYPDEVLGLPYDPSYAVRGLVIDKHYGNVLKMDRYGHVGRVYHGAEELPRDEKHRLYRLQRTRLSSPRYAWIDTLFALPEAVMFGRLVERFEQLPGRVRYEKLWQDIREAIDEAHRDDTIKRVIKADISRYLVRDPDLPATLHKFRSAGKRLFLLTNSLMDYTEAVMSYLLDGQLAPYPTWRHYFDHIVVGGGKPAFFTEKRPFLELDAAGNEKGPTRGPLLRGHVYQGGNIADFESSVGCGGDRVLYIGDHIYGDMLRAKKASVWRTAMIVQELEAELEQATRMEATIRRIDHQDRVRRRLESDIAYQQLVLRSLQRFEHDGGPERIDPSTVQAAKTSARHKLEELRGRMRELSSALEQMEAQVDQSFNRWWGPIFREGAENSRFGQQVEDYACLYTSRVSNFLAYSPLQYFRSPRDHMPHELV